MKTIIAFITGLILAATAALALPTTKLAAEWHAPWHTSPKQFALVDQATGTVRIASVSNEGGVSWTHTVPTGIQGVSDVATSLHGSNGEILALTSPESNRVALLDIDTPAPFVRVLPELSGIGPSGLASLGTTETRDLLVASALNGSTAGKLEARGGLSGSANLLAERNDSRNFRRLQPMSEPGGSTAIAIFSETFGSNTRMGLVSRSGGSLTLNFRATYTLTAEFATDVRSIHQPSKNFVVVYRPGGAITNLLEIASPLTTTSDITTSSPSLPFPVTAVIPVHGGGAGPMTDGFIAIAADGSQARWMRINPAGTAYESTGPPHQFTPESGSFLSGVIPLPGIGIVALQSTSQGGPSSSYVARVWNGAAWAIADSGSIPEIPGPATAPATLLFYSDDPAADEAARLLGVQSAGAWTRRTLPSDPLPSSVIVENFVAGATGLAVGGSQPVNPTPQTNYVITNQVEPAVSIASLGPFGALFAPDLRIEPPSGNYTHSIQATAVYDDARHELMFRRDGGAWQPWQGSLPVVWSTQLQFMLRSLANGSRGPVVTRQYTIPTSALASQDSDNDGVPDYVELYYNLDPFAGADSDGDGVSDLNEILKGTHPAIPTEFPSETFDISPGGGLSIVASARNHASSEIALNQELEARSLDGSLLARAPVTTVSPSLPDGGFRGAILRSASTVPFEELVALQSPLYFNITTGVRSGREIIGFIPADPPPVFSPAYTPTGTDLATDALNWVAAATAAAATHPPANARSIIAPADTAVSILLEHLCHIALTSARPAADPPPALDAFTLFPGRDLDRSRTPLSADDRALLRAAGFDFRRALNLALLARPAMNAAANGIYQRHVAVAATTPGMILPLDALRSILRGGNVPPGYTGAVSTGNATNALNAYNQALTNTAQAFRPMETWTIEIPAVSAERGIYQKLPESQFVALLDSSGRRFALEQGLGLRPGTQFQVTGFTDTPQDGGFPTMEITSAALSFEPASSDNDADGNLLDDEWEKFFFGVTGQDPFYQPHGNGYSLLQYFLDGVDPRGGSLPAGPAVSLAPQAPVFARGDGGIYTLDFIFPAAYQSRFLFVLERSESLAPGSFTALPDAAIHSLGADELRATVPAAAATAVRGFFRIRVRLK
jgi:hypothetical protein